jgi:hypothetical protein
MENGHPFKIDRKLHLKVDKPPMGHVSAGDEGAVQKDDVTDIQLFDIFTPDWSL